MDARIRTVHGKGGRLIPVDQFYTTYGNKLNESEMISSIQIPRVEPRAKQRFIKFRMRNTIDFAIVSVAAMITKDNQGAVSDARIVLGGISSAPMRAIEAEKLLMGERVTEHLALKAGETSTANLQPLSKNAYKIPIVQALVKRALMG
jgi:xanthine dehydrogenase YagS FAD-binding subunit